jgi:hypothetical protein
VEGRGNASAADLVEVAGDQEVESSSAFIVATRRTPWSLGIAARSGPRRSRAATRARSVTGPGVTPRHAPWPHAAASMRGTAANVERSHGSGPSSGTTEARINPATRAGYALAYASATLVP